MPYSVSKSNKKILSKSGLGIILSGSVVIVIIVFRTALGEFLESKIPMLFSKYYPAIILGMITGVILLFNEIRIKLKDFHRLDLAKMLNPIYIKLGPLHQKILKDDNLNELSNAMIKDAAEMIGELGSLTNGTIYPVNDEYKRIQLIRHLFNSQPKKEVFAVTFDYKNYFLNFWGPVLTPSFIEANRNAAKYAFITRIFVFNRSDYEDNHEKQERYKEINAQIISSFTKEDDPTKKDPDIKKIKTYILFEDELPIKMPKQSFLIIDDNITCASQFEIAKGYLAFGHRESISELTDRKNKLLGIIKAQNKTSDIE